MTYLSKHHILGTKNKMFIGTHSPKRWKVTEHRKTFNPLIWSMVEHILLKYPFFQYKGNKNITHQVAAEHCLP